MIIRNKILATCALWTLLVSISFAWNVQVDQKSHYQNALSAARSFFSQVVLTRKWNATHGGVYVPVTKTTQPNPYLDTPQRDITIDENLQLTKINPAYMTRQISEIAAAKGGVQFHITSLKPIRPANHPTSRERAILESFENGTKEVGFFTREDAGQKFYYMAPLYTEKSCLTCHAKQGYSEGDIRGGISVSLPFPDNNHFLTILTAHLGFLFIGMGGIIFFGLKLQAAYEEIKNQAVFDALTGIPNRRNFTEAILKEFRRSRRFKRPLSIIMCDIDNFKEYNDTYGHHAGDACLKQVAKAIDNTLERPGDLCARYGGEEFVIILPNTPLKGAHYIAEKTRLAVEALNLEHKNSSAAKTITLSLGAATSTESNELSPDDLIRYADNALYRAKGKGKNRVELFSEATPD